MLKKNFFILTSLFFILALGFISGSLAFAHEGHTEEEKQDMEQIVEEIRAVQGISASEKIECSKLTDEQMEKLGEAFMSSMHPEEKIHEAMDEMMGGEGSEDLQKTHTMMGRGYLGCVQPGEEFGGAMPMMGNFDVDKSEGGKDDGGSQKGGESSMMGWGQFGMGGGWMWFGWIFMILVWVAIILAVVALIKWILEKPSSGAAEKSALDILKERYAKGEIDAKEFEEKKGKI